MQRRANNRCEQLIGINQDLCISCQMNVEESSEQKYRSEIPLFAQDGNLKLLRIMLS